MLFGFRLGVSFFLLGLGGWESVGPLEFTARILVMVGFRVVNPISWAWGDKHCKSDKQEGEEPYLEDDRT